jgi:hypothetical protein
MTGCSRQQRSVPGNGGEIRIVLGIQEIEA